MKLSKNKIKAKQHPEAELLLLENYSHLHPYYHRKIIVYILQNRQKKKYGKRKLKMKNRSQRQDIKRPASRHGHRYSKYEKFLNMMTLLCIKQHFSNI